MQNAPEIVARLSLTFRFDWRFSHPQICWNMLSFLPIFWISGGAIELLQSIYIATTCSNWTNMFHDHLLWYSADWFASPSNPRMLDARDFCVLPRCRFVQTPSQNWRLLCRAKWRVNVSTTFGSDRESRFSQLASNRVGKEQKSLNSPSATRVSIEQIIWPWSPFWQHIPILLSLDTSA